MIIVHSKDLEAYIAIKAVDFGTEVRCFLIL